MKAIQTLWTAGKSLLEDAHGWLTPEYGLMSWALSAYCLSKNFNDVILYTDTEGAHVLIDLLKLPYTEVHVCYDNLICHPTHWAYSKILTYSKQEKPFIHVDGDLYLPKGLPNHYKKHSIIAQNEEKGSAYYKNIMDYIRINQKAILPEYLKHELKKEFIGSYNAGIIGGNDIIFIQKYCEEAIKIVKENNWDKSDCKYPNLNNNLLFEQLLFYVLVKKHNKKVTTIIKQVLGDNMYNYDVTCNMMYFDKKLLFHLLGGYKRNKYVCEMMRKTLLNKCPELYIKILDNFKQNHYRLIYNQSHIPIPKVDILKYISIYQSYINKFISKWNNLKIEELYSIEKDSSNYMFFFTGNHKDKSHTKISRRSIIQIFSFPNDWPESVKNMIKSKIDSISAYRFTHIVIFPTITEKGYKEILVNDLQYNIIELTANPIAYKDLLNKLINCFSKEIIDKHNCKKIIETDLEKLFYYGIIKVYN